MVLVVLPVWLVGDVAQYYVGHGQTVGFTPDVRTRVCHRQTGEREAERSRPIQSIALLERLDKQGLGTVSHSSCFRRSVYYPPPPSECFSKGP